MDVLRHGREWRMRWLTSPVRASVGRATSDSGASKDLCASCGGGDLWIAVPDLPSMPSPRVVYDCPCCRKMTAYAEFPMTTRSIGD